MKNMEKVAVMPSGCERKYQQIFEEVAFNRNWAARTQDFRVSGKDFQKKTCDLSCLNIHPKSLLILG